MSACCRGVEEMFSERTARFDLRRYRRRGPSKQTRVLLDAIRREGIDGASVLDIGGGIGAIQQELLAAGAGRATAVEASPAYLRAAREEAERRGTIDRVTYQPGDFVAIADSIDSADVVTLDRVICCYHDMQRLVSRSGEKARFIYGAVYPREGWWTRLVVDAENVWFRLRGSPFRTFLHSPSDIDSVLMAQGLRRRTLRRTVGWEVAVYTRSNPG